MKRNLTAVVFASLIIAAILCPRVLALDTVTWGGPACSAAVPCRWEDSYWTKNAIPNQSAASAMGDNTGGRGGMNITVGNGTFLEFDVNEPGEVLGDYNDNGTVDTADWVVWKMGGTLQNQVPPSDPNFGNPVAAWKRRFGNTSLDDFAPRQDQVPGGMITITGGATLYMEAHGDVDGRWSRTNLSMTIDNGTWLRTYSEPSYNAGRTMFGFGRNQPALPININVINGGHIEQHGKIVFGDVDYFIGQGGGNDGHSDNIVVAMTIDNGTVDMPLLPELLPSNPLYTPGMRYFLDYGGLLPGSLIFGYEYHQAGYDHDGNEAPGEPGHPRNETYSINFTGPGSITLNPHFIEELGITVGGIYVIKQFSDGHYESFSSTGSTTDIYTPIGYQDLWDLDILQANGQSKTQLGSAAFSTYFSVTGTQFAGPYVLTSLIAGSGAGQASAVPEPASLMMVLMGLAGVAFGRRSR